MTDTSEITVLSQNILLDKTREKRGEILPQSQRIQSIARAILDLPYRPDIIGIQEAHITDTVHNGDDLSRLCGYEPGSWVNHNQKTVPPTSSRGRKHEYIGLFGAAVGETKSIDLGDQRRALLTEVDGVAFATLHFRAGGYGSRRDRFENATKLVSALNEYDDAVVFGDFNEPHTRFISLGRRALARADFRSAFRLRGESSPKTFPTHGYQPLYERLSRWALDDILIRGDRVKPISTGTLEYSNDMVKADKQRDNKALNATDHSGVWARLGISPQK